MRHESTRVEKLHPYEPTHGTAAEPPWTQSGRVKLFAVTFGLVLLSGLAWTLLQPVVYRSSATVLMSAPRAIDAAVTEADIQSVAIQRKILLGGEITRQLAAELADKHGRRLDGATIQSLLRVNPVPDTNLVEMSAQGSDDELLPLLVSRWIDVYLAVRAAEIEQRKEQTLQVVQAELDGLGIKLEQARAALEQYRLEHNIISAERQENEVLARLDGLNSALNNAIEEEVKAGAYLDTLRRALQRGEQVVPQSERRGVEALSTELRELQAEMAELTQRYTMEYINKQPRLRAIPERIDELAGELAQALSQGREAELASARQAHGASRQAVRDLQLKLDGHKQRVSQFNTIYATHQALAQDLARLEELNRDTQSRLVQVEVRQVEKYPQVSVIDPPGPDSERLGPDYLLLLGGSVLAALVLGIFSVWLHGFLSPRRAQPAYVTLSGVHLYPQEVSGELGYTSRPDPRLAEPETKLLPEDATGTDHGDQGPAGGR